MFKKAQEDANKDWLLFRVVCTFETYISGIKIGKFVGPNRYQHKTLADILKPDFSEDDEHFLHVFQAKQMFITHPEPQGVPPGTTLGYLRRKTKTTCFEGG